MPKGLHVRVETNFIMVFDEHSDMVLSIGKSLAREIAAALYNDDLTNAQEFARG